MRAVTHGDTSSAARALLNVPSAIRRAVLSQMLHKAHAADRYRKRTGDAHPIWGNGSLMAVARMGPMGNEPDLGDPDYCECLVQVLEAIVCWRRERMDKISL